MKMKKEQKLLKKSVATDIIPADDAFHGSPKQISAEWWYFDTIFNNGYSAHLGFKTFSRKNLGMVSPMIEFYKDGKLIVQKQTRHLFKNFITSKKFPKTEILNKPIISFDLDRYNKTGEWFYNFNLKIENNSVNLNFKNLTKGWKIQTEKESWTVALPKAEVSGESIINGEKMNVEGYGYHDHNWNYNLLTVMNYGIGWYWGRIRTKNYNLVFAKIIKSGKKYEILTVINKDQNGFYNISPEKIDFESKKFVRKRRKKIPSEFSLKINETVKNSEIIVDLDLKSEQIHLDKALLAPYYRYHTKAKGFISVDGNKEEISDTQIIEYLRFS